MIYNLYNYESTYIYKSTIKLSNNTTAAAKPLYILKHIKGTKRYGLLCGPTSAELIMLFWPVLGNL